MMFFNDIFGSLTTCEILNLAKNMLNYSSSFMCREDDEKHYYYFLWQTRKKITEIMNNTDVNMLNTRITYDVLVNREAYKRNEYNSVYRYGATPHELNEKREAAIKSAEERMKDVPVQGFENYAIVKVDYVSEISKINIHCLREHVANMGKIAAFLWYDFINENDRLMFPIITW